MKEHIEAIQKYMMEKYGVVAQVEVNVFDHLNDGFNRDKADLITNEVAKEFRAKSEHWEHKDTAGARVQNWEYKFSFSTFYPRHQYTGNQQ